MGGFLATWVVPVFWVAALCPAVNSKIPSCTREAPVCSSTLYPLCVYSEDCKPAWECVSLSNLLQSIFTKFRCHPPNAPETDTSTKPYPATSKPKNGESDTSAKSHPFDESIIPCAVNQDSKEKFKPALSQSESLEQPVPDSSGSRDAPEKDTETLNDVKSSLSAKSAPYSIKSQNIKSNPGNIIEDISPPEELAGGGPIPKTGLELEQLFDSDGIAKFTPFSQNKINPDKHKKIGGGPSQIDWSGFGSIDPLPSGKSRSRQLKPPVLESKPDLKNQKLDVANKPNVLADISSVGPVSNGLRNPPMVLEDESKPTDSQKTSDLDKFGLPLNVKSKLHGKKALGTGAIVEANDPSGSKVDQDHQLDSNINTEISFQTKHVSTDQNKAGDSHDDVEDQSKTHQTKPNTLPDTKLTDSKSSEPQEFANAPSEESARPSLNSHLFQKPGSLVKAMLASQIERAPQPTLLPFARPPSKTTVAHDSELPLQNLAGSGNLDLGSPPPEGLKKNRVDNRETPNTPRSSTSKNGSSNQKKNGSTVVPSSTQESDEASDPEPLVHHVQGSSEKLNSASQKYPDTDSNGPQTDQPPLGKPLKKNPKPRPGSSYKGRHKSHGSNTNTKYG